AEAGIQLLGAKSNSNGWIPASAGMTNHLHGPSTKPSYRRRPVSSFYARFSPTPKSWIPAFADMTSKETPELAAFGAIQLLAAVVSALHRAQGGQGLRKFDKTESLSALRAALSKAAHSDQSPEGRKRERRG
ncbi:hypothetical protein, partial [Tahibacter soli]